MDKQFINTMASIQHDIWSHWQRYLHSKCIENEDGSLTIPKELVERWSFQMKTDYDILSKQEQKSDIEQVIKIIPTILEWFNPKY